MSKEKRKQEAQLQKDELSKLGLSHLEYNKRMNEWYTQRKHREKVERANRPKPQPKQTKRRDRQEILLKAFSNQTIEHYEEKQVEDCWFVKMYNAGNKKWQIAIYSKESFAQYKQFSNSNK